MDNFVSHERDFNQVTKYKCNFEAERLWENYFGRRIVGVERVGGGGREVMYVCVCISSRIKLGTRKIERDPFKNIHIFLNHFDRNLASYLQSRNIYIFLIISITIEIFINTNFKRIVLSLKRRNRCT